jgi:hypothetical protein
MEKLREYLNSLTTEQQAMYAQICGTTVGYLRKAICVGAKLDSDLCVLLDENSNGLVPREYLRPKTWPERLKGK